MKFTPLYTWCNIALRLRQPLLVLGLTGASCLCVVLHKPAGNALCLHKWKSFR